MAGLKKALGPVVLGLSGLAWIVAMLVYGGRFMEWAGIVLGVAGWATAAVGAHARDGPRLRVGLWLAAVGMGLFLIAVLPGGFGPGTAAALLFTTGSLALAGGARAAGNAARAGAALAAIGGAVWVVSDGLAGASWWQPGNVLSLVGMALVAWTGLPRTPPA